MTCLRYLIFLFFTLVISIVSNAQCSITAISTGTQTACDPLTNYYTQEITVTYSNAPGVGSLDVNGQSFSITGSPQTITLTNLYSDGLPVDVTAVFSSDQACTFTQLASFTAPADCLPNPPGQIDNFTDCDPHNLGIPQEFLDYSSNPDTVSQLILDFDSGQGECCNLSSNQNCYHVEIFLSPESEGISFNFSGASGSFYIYEPCSDLETATEPNDNAYTDIQALGGSVYDINQIICVDGVGPHEFMICRPGGANPYTIDVVSYPAPSGTGDLTVTEGCFVDLAVQGLDPASITWTSIDPAPTGQYNDLIVGYNGGTEPNPHTGEEQIQIAPLGSGIPEVTYEVCGNTLLGSVCSTVPPPPFCATSTITIFPDLFADAGPNQAICAGGTIAATLTGSAINSDGTGPGGTAPYTFAWTGPESVTHTNVYPATPGAIATDDFSVNTLGQYTLTITDITGCTIATDIVDVFEYDTDIESFINSSSTSVCYDLLVPINLEGYVTETYTGEWTASPNVGTFSTTNIDGTATAPNNDPQTVTWTPDGTATGQVTLTLTPTNNLGCPITPASIIIDLTEFTPGSLTATPTPINCNGAGNGSIDLVIVPGVPDYFDGGTPVSYTHLTLPTNREV